RAFSMPTANARLIQRSKSSRLRSGDVCILPSPFVEWNHQAPEEHNVVACLPEARRGQSDARLSPPLPARSGMLPTASAIAQAVMHV
ncbi:MAG: hypothetical protein KAX26_16750, partial [Anaerolineae bacterium]|nr:hypothetical protein [Anaerolineae bacterium]